MYDPDAICFIINEYIASRCRITPNGRPTENFDVRPGVVTIIDDLMWRVSYGEVSRYINTKTLKSMIEIKMSVTQDMLSGTRISDDPKEYFVLGSRLEACKQVLKLLDEGGDE